MHSLPNELQREGESTATLIVSLLCVVREKKVSCYSCSKGEILALLDRHPLANFPFLLQSEAKALD